MKKWAFITVDMKKEIIERMDNKEPADVIAEDLDVSETSVKNIYSQWRNSRGTVPLEKLTSYHNKFYSRTGLINQIERLKAILANTNPGLLELEKQLEAKDLEIEELKERIEEYEERMEELKEYVHEVKLKAEARAERRVKVALIRQLRDELREEG